MRCERFHRIWQQRAYGGVISHSMTDEEYNEVLVHWRAMTDGYACFVDAFHSLWRAVDPDHDEMFAGTEHEQLAPRCPTCGVRNTSCACKDPSADACAASRETIVEMLRDRGLL